MSIPLFPIHIPLCCLVLLLSSHFVRCCSNDFPFQTHPSGTRTDLACVPNDGPFRWQIIEKPWDFGGFPWSFGLSLSSLRNWWRCFTLFYLVQEFGILSRNLLVFIFDILWYFWLCSYRTAPKCARPGWFPSGSEAGPALVECACRFESKLMVKNHR